MANRYWVGGSASWDGTAGTKWSDTSGGAGGFSVPTTADDVFFTNLSTGTCTIATGNTGAKSINCTGFTGTIAGTSNITVAGSITLDSGMTFTHTGIKTITGTATITSAGKTFGSLTMNAVGITVSLADNLNIGGGNNINLFNGSIFNTNNFTLTCGTFTKSSSNAITLNLGSSTINVGTLTFSGTNITLTGTSLFNITGGTTSQISSVVNFYNVTQGTLNTVNITGAATFNTYTCSGTLSISANCTFNTLSLLRSSLSGVQTILLGSDVTINNFSNHGPAFGLTYRVFIRSNIIGTTRTIFFSGTSTAYAVDFQDITFSGNTFTGTSVGNAFGNTNITFTPAKTVYWNSANASENWSANAWALTSGGSVSSANFPLPQDTAIFDNNSPTVTVSIDFAYNLPSIDSTARTSGNIELANTITAPLFCGNLLIGNVMTVTGNVILAGRNATSVQCPTTTLPDITLRLFGAGALAPTVTFTGNVNCGAINFEYGRLNFGTGTTINTGSLLATNNSETGGGSREWDFRTATVNMSGGVITLINTGSSGLTASPNAQINLTANSTARTLTLIGNRNIGSINIGGTGTGNTSFAGTSGAWVQNLTSTKTEAHTITFAVTGTSTYTINNLNINGSAGKPVTIRSATTNTIRSITYGATSINNLSYLTFQDIDFVYSGACAIYATNSTNNGNVMGVGFFDSTVSKAFILRSGTSWTVPADWNSANNNIYLFGAGGGGANGAVSGNNRAAGGGGGGGGYTGITNFSATPSSTISYAIGTSVANANGGNTTFNSGAYIAGGGQVGTATTTPSSTGGAGGTGTFAGGTGGRGAFGTAASTGYASGGGGGAGGPNGVGGNGGIGNASTVASSIGGGGGGGNGGGTNGTNSSGSGGVGGNNSSGIGSGLANNNGFQGGGGGGQVNTASLGSGGIGKEILNSFGGGGGNGGTAGSTTIAPSFFGGGGKGGSVTTAGVSVGNAGAGGQGAIFIVYTIGSAPAANGNFFFMFG